MGNERTIFELNKAKEKENENKIFILNTRNLIAYKL